MAPELDTRITQKYLRRWPTSKRTKSWAGKAGPFEGFGPMWEAAETIAATTEMARESVRRAIAYWNSDERKQFAPAEAH